MNLYRFSPITTESAFREAIAYCIQQAELLATKVIGHPLPITYVTIFAHYDDEYENLAGLIKPLGELSGARNGVKVMLRESIRQEGQNITELRVRKPDPYRMQVGCCDFSVDDYEAFKAKHLSRSKNLRLIKRPDCEMIEFFRPDFDILAYVLSNKPRAAMSEQG